MALRTQAQISRLTSIPILRSSPAASMRFFASKSQSSPSSKSSGDIEGLGVVGKGDKNARPVILDDATPADPKDPEVKKHNEEFEKRPDRAANVINEKNEPAVNKDFWKGSGGVDRQP